MDPVIGGALIGGVLQGANSLFNLGANKKNRQFAEDMYNRQRADALADRQFENDYNSPAAQMARLKAGGLNPNLMYGQGTSGMQSVTTRQSQVQQGNNRPAQIDTSAIVNAAMAILTMKKTETETDRIKALTDLAKEDKLNAVLKGRGMEIENYVADKSKGYRVNEAENRALKTGADYDYTVDQNERAKKLSEQTLLESAERIAKSQAERQGMLPQQIAKIKQEIKNLETDGKIKAYIAEMHRVGINPSDPAYLRVANRIANDIMDAVEGKNPNR